MLAVAAVLLAVPTAQAKPHRAHATTHAEAKAVAKPVSRADRSARHKPTPQHVHAEKPETRSTRELRHSTTHHIERNPAPLLIEVRGSRSHGKHHRATAAAAPAGPVVSRHRKATSADFLSAIPVDTTDKLVSGVSHPDLAPLIPAAATPAAQPTSVVSLVRTPEAVRPQLATVADENMASIILPTLYNKRGRLIVPPPLKGSHEILLRQNQVADRDGLDRVQDDNDLDRMREAHMLVPVPISEAMVTDDRLPTNRRYVRPWTAVFLASMARAHYARFHSPLQVNSAVRTVSFQQQLIHVNGNAAPAEGDTASPHLTGQAIDLAKHGLSLTEIAWMRGYLLPLVQEGKIDVEEEFQQSCFHISVYKRYLPGEPMRRITTSHRIPSTALAAAIQ
jgi:hypothetical protein